MTENSPGADFAAGGATFGAAGKSRLKTMALTLTASLFLSAGSLPARSADSDITPQIPTTDSQLRQEADKIHKEAMRSLDASDPFTAIAKENQAAKLLPGYWLPHAALGYMHLGRGGPAIDEAELSVATEHPVLADVNRGLILQWFRLYDQAIESFNRALARDPDNLEAKVGIAGCLIAQGKTSEATKLVDEAYAKAPADPHLLDAVARTYFDCGDMNKTKDACKKALLCPATKEQAASLRRLAMVAAVKSSDAGLLAALNDKITPRLEPYELAWMRAGQLRLAQTVTEASTVLRFAEAVKTSGPEWIAYSSIIERKAESASSGKAEWLNLARLCLERAETSDPNRLQNRILLASFEEKGGNEKAAVAKLTEGWQAPKDSEQWASVSASARMQKTELNRLGTAITREGGGDYRSYISAVQYKLPKATCHCRYTHWLQTIKCLPGVIDVMIGEGEKPLSLVLFDSRKTSTKAIFQSAAVRSSRDQYEIVEDQKLATITQLGELVERYQPPLPQPYLLAERVKLTRPWPVDDRSRDDRSRDDRHREAGLLSTSR